VAEPDNRRRQRRYHVVNNIRIGLALAGAGNNPLSIKQAFV
jgi:hypothetical protein